MSTVAGNTGASVTDAFREAVRRDLREVADYGSDNTSSVTARVWKALYGDAGMPDDLEDTLGDIVDDEWDRYFEEDEE